MNISEFWLKFADGYIQGLKYGLVFAAGMLIQMLAYESNYDTCIKLYDTLPEVIACIDKVTGK